jgi:hypothetical protein
MCYDRLKMRVLGEKEVVLAVFGALGAILTNHRLPEETDYFFPGKPKQKNVWIFTVIFCFAENNPCVSLSAIPPAEKPQAGVKPVSSVFLFFFSFLIFQF